MLDEAPPEITAELLEKNPLLALSLSAFSLLIIAFLAGCLASWIFLGIRAKRGIPWLRVERWTPRVWGLVDVLVVAIAVVACQVLFASIGVRLLDVEPSALSSDKMPLSLTAFINSGNIAAIVLSALWIMLRYQVGLGHVGFRFNGFPRQVSIGVIAALATLPLVYLLMAGVSLGFETQYDHPLLDEMKNSATLLSYLLGVATAVIVAPLAEEFLFRVIIQGWLQSIPFGSIKAALLGASENQRAEPVTASIVAEPGMPLAATAGLEGAVAGPTATDNFSPPYAPYAETPVTTNGDESDPASAKQVPPVWPSIVTGILFGLAHWGYGLSFIPLILLGIILGLLYRATQSIWPCVILHMTLNASSMLALGVGLLVERAAG